MKYFYSEDPALNGLFVKSLELFRSVKRMRDDKLRKVLEQIFRIEEYDEEAIQTLLEHQQQRERLENDYR